MKPSGDLILPTERRRLAIYLRCVRIWWPSPHSLAQLATLTGRQPIVISRLKSSVLCAEHPESTTAVNFGREA